MCEAVNYDGIPTAQSYHCFLGQVEINNYFHDEAAAYVFHDPKSDGCETVIQVYSVFG